MPHRSSGFYAGNADFSGRSFLGYIESINAKNGAGLKAIDGAVHLFSHRNRPCSAPQRGNRSKAGSRKNRCSGFATSVSGSRLHTPASAVTTPAMRHQAGWLGFLCLLGGRTACTACHPGGWFSSAASAAAPQWPDHGLQRGQRGSGTPAASLYRSTTIQSTMPSIPC